MLITNIQRFSLHDGPGIRTTVFLKGCTVCCPWCANPENISEKEQEYRKNGKLGVYGRKYTTEELMSELLKDAPFYGKEGGITFSGGEPLLHIRQLIPILSLLREKGISAAVETSLFVAPEAVELGLPLLDYIFVDFKIMNADRCRSILGGDMHQFIKNLDILTRAGKKFTARVPVISGYTDDSENSSLILKMLKKYKESILKVEILKGHSLGESKYLSLNKTPPIMKPVETDYLTHFCEDIRKEVGVLAEVLAV